MQRRLLALVIGLAAALPATADAARPHVVGGGAAAPGAYPFVAALVPASEPDASHGQFCGAALIAPRVAVTAAHCVLSTSPEDVDVVVGRSRLSASGGQRVHVAGITMHPLLTLASGAIRHDVAVLRLAGSVTGITPGVLPPSGAPPVPGSVLTVVGWGLTNLDGAAPDDLQAGAVTRIADPVCAGEYGRAFDAATMFCAGGGGVDTCAGDSGGPILQDLGAGGVRIVGVVSFGISCAVDRFPGVYTRITTADTHDWLTSSPADTPFAFSSPSLDGQPTVGGTLDCGRGSWIPATGLTFSRLWLRDEVEIAGQTGAHYTATAADRGSAISCVVLARNASGTVGSESPTTPPIGPRAPARDRLAPRVTGSRVTCTGTRCTMRFSAVDAPYGTGVGSVEVAIRTGASLAILTAHHQGGTLWTLRRTLVPGTAVVFARAVDHAGNRQRLARRVLVHVADLAPARPVAHPRIIDGLRASTADFPFVAALVDATTTSAADGQFCGGTLIAPTVVVTAAHCAAATRADQIDAVFGRDVLSGSAGERIHVVAVSWHPAFTFDLLRSDVAVLRLAHAPAAPIRPVAMVGPGDVAALAGGSPATIVGWGATYDSPDAQVYPDDLRQAAVTLATDATCARDVGRSFDAATMTCAVTVAGRNVCNGDSGGPLLVPDGAGGWRLAGITSWGLKCGSTASPAVFGRVLGLRAFVDSSPPPGPVQTGPVYVDGSFAVGTPVRCHTAGRFTTPGAGPAPSLRYRWALDFSEVRGATGVTLVPAAEDIGKQVQCAVTATNAGGTLPETFSDVATVGFPLARDTRRPTIDSPRIRCTETLGVSARACRVSVRVAEETGIARVTFLVDVIVAGSHHTRLLDGGSGGTAALPRLAAGSIVRIAARAVDGAGNASRTALATVSG